MSNYFLITTLYLNGNLSCKLKIRKALELSRARVVDKSNNVSLVLSTMSDMSRVMPIQNYNVSFVAQHQWISCDCIHRHHVMGSELLSMGQICNYTKVITES